MQVHVYIPEYVSTHVSAAIRINAHPPIRTLVHSFDSNYVPCILSETEFEYITCKKFQRSQLGITGVVRNIRCSQAILSQKYAFVMIADRGCPEFYSGNARLSHQDCVNSSQRKRTLDFHPILRRGVSGTLHRECSDGRVQGYHSVGATLSPYNLSTFDMTRCSSLSTLVFLLQR